MPACSRPPFSVYLSQSARHACELEPAAAGRARVGKSSEIRQETHSRTGVMTPTWDPMLPLAGKNWLWERGSLTDYWALVSGDSENERRAGHLPSKRIGFAWNRI